MLVNKDIAMIAVPVLAIEPTLIAGEPKPVLQGDVGASGGGRFYDIHPDGRRFLMFKGSSRPAPRTHLVVVQNWFEELKRLVPTGN